MKTILATFTIVILVGCSLLDKPIFRGESRREARLGPAPAIPAEPSSESCSDTTLALSKSEEQVPLPTLEVEVEFDLCEKREMALSAWDVAMKELLDLESKFTETVKDKPEESVLRAAIGSIDGALAYHRRCSEYHQVKARLEVLLVELVSIYEAAHQEQLTRYSQLAQPSDKPSKSERLRQSLNSSLQQVLLAHTPRMLIVEALVQHVELSEELRSPVRGVDLHFASADLAQAFVDHSKLESEIDSRFLELRVLAKREQKAANDKSLEGKLDAAALVVERSKLELSLRLLLSAERAKNAEIEKFLKLAIDGPSKHIEQWASERILQATK